MYELSLFEFIKIISSIFYKLFFMSIKASILGIVILIFLKIFNKHITPRIKYIIFFNFIILLIFPISINNKFSILPSKIENIEKNLEDDIQEYIENFRNDDVNKKFILNKDTNDKLIIENNINFKLGISFLWFIIVIIILIIYIICYEIFNNKIQKNYIDDKNFLTILERCKKRLNITKSIRAVNQQLVYVPSLFGIVNPKIIFNQNIDNITNEELEYILTHELTHYKRRDNLSNLIIITLKVLYCFNPIVWILLEELKKYMEMAVDYSVTKDLSEEEKKAYCKTLVKLTARSSNLFLAKEVSLSDNKRILKDRINMIKVNFRPEVIYLIFIIFMIFFAEISICLKENYKVENIIKILSYSLTLDDEYKFEVGNKIYYYEINDDNTFRDEYTNNFEEGNKVFDSNDDYRLIIISCLDMLYNLNKNDLQYNYIGKEKYNNHKCVVYSIFSYKNQEYIEWRYWVDLKTGFILKEEYYSNNGNDKKLPVFKIEYEYKKVK